MKYYMRPNSDVRASEHFESINDAKAKAIKFSDENCCDVSIYDENEQHVASVWHRYFDIHGRFHKTRYIEFDERENPTLIQTIWR